MVQFQKSKKQKLHLSRKLKMQRNPIPWIILLIVSAALFYQVAPDYKTWDQQKEEIKFFSTENIELEKKSSELENLKKELEDRFTKQAEENASLQNQLFPKEIDSAKIAQIFEIYGLLLDPQTKAFKSRRSIFEIKTLSIGTTSPKKGESYSITPISMNINVDKNNFKKFLTFIKENKIPDTLREKIVSQSTKGNASINFLENNILPINTISTLSLNKLDSKEISRLEVFNVQIQIVFYSQP